MAAGVTKPRQTLRTIDDLVSAQLIPQQRSGALGAVAARYAIAVTADMAALVDASASDDPISRQFVPDARELRHYPEESADPIGDDLKSPVPGLVHRYPDRVLLKVVGICPVYCRFCFRREMVGPDAGRSLTPGEIAAAFDYIRQHNGIFEVILTGGDPLMLSPRRIGEVMSALSAIPHVKIARWHTRVPVVAPDTVTTEMVAALRDPRLATFLGLHANHPRELSGDARRAIARLVDAGIPVLSQSVLLAGVNDDADTLEALMRRFVENRITPYYLHHGDLAPGTAHFRVPIARGLEIMLELDRRLTGIARPDYVLDLPGAHGKVSLLSANVRRVGEGYEITDRNGQVHLYRDVLPLAG